MKFLRFIVKLLLVVGALNWGLIGFFNMDVLSNVLGGYGSMGARVVYALIGLAGVWKLICMFRCCGKGSCGPGCGCGCCKK